MIVGAIALNTFREAVRDKILYVLLGFGVLMILVSRAIGYVSIDQDVKIMMDIGLGAIWMFSGMVSIFIGTGLIYKEIEKRTLYTILSKPAPRWQFLVGKYFGLALTTAVNLLFLAFAFLGYLVVCGAPVTLGLIEAIFLIFMEMLVVTAVAIFFSSVSTPILSAIMTTVVFLAGQLTKWVLDLSNSFASLSQTSSVPWLPKALRGVYSLLPNLHNFNIRKEAVLQSQGYIDVAITPYDLGMCTAWGLAYTAVLLIAANFMFSRRNF